MDAVRAAASRSMSKFLLKTAMVLLFLVCGLMPASGPSPAIAQGQPKDPLKAAIAREITAYLSQFKTNCFADPISIGDPNRFIAAMDKSINRIIVGAEGKKRIAEMAPSSQSFHHTWNYIGQTADIVFPFDPMNIPPGAAGFKNRQTLVHEFTHHVEWLNNVKQSSDGGKNPASERNTNYQDGVVNALRQISSIEAAVGGNTSMGKMIMTWQSAENAICTLESGKPNGKKPDSNLDAMTGFHATFDVIERRYLNNSCGKGLRAVAALSKQFPNLKQDLQFAQIPGPNPSLKASLFDMNMQELQIPAALQPTIRWRMAGGIITSGNPAPLPESKAPYTLRATLDVTFEGNHYEIGEGEMEISPATPTTAAEGQADFFVVRLQGEPYERARGSVDSAVINSFSAGSYYRGQPLPPDTIRHTVHWEKDHVTMHSIVDAAVNTTSFANKYLETSHLDVTLTGDLNPAHTMLVRAEIISKRHFVNKALEVSDTSEEDETQTIVLQNLPLKQGGSYEGDYAVLPDDTHYPAAWVGVNLSGPAAKKHIVRWHRTLSTKRHFGISDEKGGSDEEYPDTLKPASWKLSFCIFKKK